MRYVVEFVSLVVFLPLALRYCKTHPEMVRGPPPIVFTRWTRGRRLAFIWASITLTVVVAVPACLTSVFLMLDAETCTIVTSAFGACHSAMRVGVGAGILCVFFIGTFKWPLLLARVHNFQRNIRFQ
jgi:hypothetical protein